jgi:hypothetical protein
MRVSRPSPGLVVAIVALVSALAGSAIALPGQNKVNSGDIKNGQVKRNDQAADQRTDWALIDTVDEEIIRQSGGISLTATSNGFAYVDFGQNIADRPISATAKWPASDASAVVCGGGPTGVACKQGDNPRNIYVEFTPSGEATVYVAVLPK